MTEFAILEKRLRRVESENRRLWWLAISLLVFAGGTVAWGEPETYLVVKARELNLSESVRVRGQFIGWGDGAPVLELYGGDTGPNSMLSAKLGIFAPKGGIILSLGSSDLLFVGENLNNSVRLSVNSKNGTGELRFIEKGTRQQVLVRPLDLANVLGPAGQKD